MIQQYQRYRTFFSVILLALGLTIFGVSRAECAEETSQQMGAVGEPLPAIIEDFEYDPWEPFNTRMFAFNRRVDRFFLKPVATGWDFVLPNLVQRGISNILDNIDVVRRITNNLLQLKFGGAGREVARFTINSTVGVVGFFDVAKDGFGIEESDEDTGQTFGVWGMGPGPFLVLPFLPVMTVRDGFGSLFDRVMHPLFWVSILVDGAEPVGPGVFALNAINERSLNLETFEQVEETVIDLYSAVRNGFLQRREAAIRE